MAYLMPKFTCRSCGMPLSRIKSYVNHQILHRYEANRNFPCCFSDCKQKFNKYTALKAHVYRSHNSTVSQLDNIPSTFVCDYCKKQCIDLRDDLAHLKVHLSKHELVHCPFNNCKTFRVKSSFTSHVSHTHRHETDENTRFTYSEPSESSQIEPKSAMDESKTQPQVTEPFDIKSLYIRNLCLFYMQLQAKYLVPSSTIQ